METTRHLVDDETIDRRLTAYTKPGCVLVTSPLTLPLQGLPDPLLSVLIQPDRWMAAPLYLVHEQVCHPVYLLYGFNPSSPFRHGLRGETIKFIGEPADWVSQRLSDTFKHAVARLRASSYACDGGWLVNSFGLVSTLRREGSEPQVVRHDPARLVMMPTAERLRRLAYKLGVPTDATAWAVQPGVSNALQAQMRPGLITWVR